jgi:hypothetical protein
MKRRILRCTILVLGCATFEAAASADDTGGIEGAWFSFVTPVDCITHTVLPNVPAFRGLYMFGHDGLLTNEAAFPGPSVLRSSGIGTWRHTQADTYTSAFWFFRYNGDGSFLALRRVTSTIVVKGDQWTSFDMFQDFDFNDKPTQAMGCNVVSAQRPQ